MGLGRAALDPRGRFADIGGRRMHWVEAGPPKSTAPLIVFEAGSFGFSADWAVVQERLAARGLRSIAYDRAGLGLSDRGPSPRDGLAIAEDLEKLLAAIGEGGPFILVGHSMAGLHVHLFAGRNPRQVAGLVLVDAIDPEGATHPMVRRYAVHFGRLSHLAAGAASLGLFKPLTAALGDRIELTEEAAPQKRWAFAHGPHNRAASEEVQHWEAAARQARQAGALDPAWPVAVVTAGSVRGFAWSKAIQARPAQASRHGHVANVATASHANLLGRRHADAIVDGILHVCQALTKAA
ncbi:alpha/beta fold hydrolase [Phenylobacterium montanum]|uniref:Alpha/beta fold hydrolase n=1 Tax=Phenylobacterium montanum TaxID=2823693 RepID=A0A975FY33_9CAUL|nr:alpha/beta fold hydrolase [Caulobacter sp. S6]QUD87052.1 alpha/beta fold hydrolase [Caulobacter sp. S6]